MGRFDVERPAVVLRDQASRRRQDGRQDPSSAKPVAASLKFAARSAESRVGPGRYARIRVAMAAAWHASPASTNRCQIACVNTRPLLI